MISTLTGYAKLFFQAVIPVTLPLAVGKHFCFASYPCQQLYLIIACIMAIMKWYFVVALVLHFLMKLNIFSCAYGSFAFPLL